MERCVNAVKRRLSKACATCGSDSTSTPSTDVDLFDTSKGTDITAGGCVNALKEWTGKARATIIYDSMVDEFTLDGLLNKVKGKTNVAVIGFTTVGDVFGGFYGTARKMQGAPFHDPNVFIFSFESHGRCATPQRFAVKEELKSEAFVRFWKDDRFGFVSFWVDGAGGFFLGDERSESFCSGLSSAFEGLEDTTLTGKSFQKIDLYHHCYRLVAVQLE